MHILSVIRSRYPSLYLISSILILYALLQGIFYVYLGLIDPRGSIYSGFLSRYSFIQYYLDLLISCTRFILEVLGYTTRESVNGIGILNGNGVRIAHGCLGIHIMIAYTALITPIPGRKKLLFWICGIAGVFIFNVLRVVSIILFNHSIPGFIYLSHEVFNYVGYAFIFGIFYVWFRKFAALNV